MVGAIGHFFAARAAVPSTLFFFGLFWLYSGFLHGDFFIPILGIMVFVGSLLQLFGHFGFWTNYSSQLGMAAFVYGLAAVTLFLVGILSMGTPWFLFLLISFILFGVLGIVEGASFVVVRHFTGFPRACIAAGVLFIIGGAFIITVFLAPVGASLLVAALIIGGIILAKAQLRFVDQTPPRYGIPVPPPPAYPPQGSS